MTTPLYPLPGPYPTGGPQELDSPHAYVVMMAVPDVGAPSRWVFAWVHPSAPVGATGTDVIIQMARMVGGAVTNTTTCVVGLDDLLDPAAGPPALRTAADNAERVHDSLTLQSQQALRLAYQGVDWAPLLLDRLFHGRVPTPPAGWMPAAGDEGEDAARPRFGPDAPDWVAAALLGVEWDGSPPADRLGAEPEEWDGGGRLPTP